jgi:serine/threonine protein kinase/Flp pilus assembly protein TadD
MPVEEPALPDLLELLRLEQQECWRRGDRVIVEAYFARHPKLRADETSVLHLVYNEVLLREAEGERPQLEEYVRRFPQLAGKLSPLFEVHRAIESDQLLGVVAGQPSPTGKLAEKAVAQLGATIDDSVTERAGTVIGPYKLLQQIGEGGMGTVYMAEQSHPVQRKVALKIIKPGMDSRQVIARFEAERQALALMDHPNIAKVLDAGATSEGRPYFVMELVKGVPITRYCDDHHLTPRERLELFVPVCQAVQHAHQKGIIHRDLKPSNVMVCIYDGKPVPKVIDFGVAKATGPKLTDRTLYTEFGAIVGTFEYMSPEQAQLDQLDVDTRSDIYSLGVLLYELLTGTTPLERKRLKEAAVLELLRLVREEEAPRPSTRLSTAEGLPSIAANRGTEPRKLSALMRGELDWIVMKALEKDRDRRYETANGLAHDIERHLHDEPVLACPPSAGYRFRKYARRNKPALFMAAMVSTALVLGVVGLVIANYQIAQQRNLATEQRDLAQREHDQAEANLEKARKAVDQYFTLVSASPLLETPGLETLRKQLLDTALGYYEDFVKQHGRDSALLADVAAANIRVAQINYLNGGGADRYFPPMRDGVDAVERLVAEGRDTPQVQQRLTRIWLGGFPEAEDAGTVDPNEVRRYLEKEVKIWEKFVHDNPGVPEFRNDLAGGCIYLSGTWPGNDGVRWCDRAIEIWQKLARENPKAFSYRVDLARSYEQRARRLREMGRGPEADKELEKALLLRRDLARDFPERAQHRAWLASSYRTVGEAQNAGNQPKQAEKTLRQALEIQEKLVADFPAAHTHQDDLARTQLALAAVLKKLDRSQEAEASYRQALVSFERLVVAFPKAARYQTELLQTAKDLAQLLEASGQPEKKKQVLDVVFAVYEKLTAQSAKTPEDLKAMAAVYQNLANLLRDSGQPKEAEKAYGKGLDLLRQRAAEFPAIAGRREDLGLGYREFAYWLQGAEKDQERAQLLRESIKVWESLAADFPDVPSHRHWLAATNEWLGVVLFHLKLPKESEKYYQKAIELIATLPADFLTHVDSIGGRATLDNTFNGFANLLKSNGRHKETEKIIRQAIDLYKRLVAFEPSALGYKQDLAKQYVNLAALLQDTGKAEEAAKAYRNALAVGEKLVADSPTREPEYHYRLAAYYLELRNLLRNDHRLTEAIQLTRQAVDSYEKLAANHLDEPDINHVLVRCYIYLAEVLREAGHPQEAEQVYRRLLALADKLVADPRSEGHLVFTYDHLGHVLKDAGKREEAAKAYRKALAIEEKRVADSPKTPDEWRILSDAQEQLIGVLRQMGKSQELESVYRRFVARYEKLAAAFPNVPDYRKELARNHNRLGLHLRQAGRSQEAQSQLSKAQDYWRADSKPELERLKKAADGDRKDGFRRDELAKACYRFGNWEECLDIFKAWGITGSAWQWFYIAMAHGQLDHQEEARWWYFRSLDWMATAQEERLRDVQAEAAAVLGLSDPGDRLQQAWNLSEEGAAYEKGQPEKAKESYSRAIDTYAKLAADFPAVPAYYAKLLELLSKTGRQQEGVELAKLLLEREPENALLANTLGSAYRKFGDMLNASKKSGEAETAYRKALALHEKFPKDEGCAQGLVADYFALAHLCGALGRIEESQKIYRQLLMLVKHAVSLNNLAWLLATCADSRLRNPTEAVTLAKRAVELEPNNGMWWNTLGAAHYQAGNWKAAIEALNKSMELRKGGDGFDWFFLAMARWQLGDKKDARKWYDKAVQWMDKNQPKDEELRRFRAETETLLKVENKPMAK